MIQRIHSIDVHFAAISAYHIDAINKFIAYSASLWRLLLGSKPHMAKHLISEHLSICILIMKRTLYSIIIIIHHICTLDVFSVCLHLYLFSQNEARINYSNAVCALCLYVSHVLRKKFHTYPLFIHTPCFIYYFMC